MACIKQEPCCLQHGAANQGAGEAVQLVQLLACSGHVVQQPGWQVRRLQEHTTEGFDAQDRTQLSVEEVLHPGQ